MLKNKFKLLNAFDWKLFLALVLLSLVPAIIQTVWNRRNWTNRMV